MMNESLRDFILFVELSLENLFVHGVSHADTDSIGNVQELESDDKKSNTFCDR
jgi:hypothetical protein